MEGRAGFGYALIFRALIAWCAAALPLLLIGALIADKAELNEQGAAYLSTGISLITAAAAGAAGARAWKGAKIICGLLCGGVITLILLMLGFIIAGDALPPAGVLSVVSFTFCGSLLGSVLSPRGRARKKSAVKVQRR